MVASGGGGGGGGRGMDKLKTFFAGRIGRQTYIVYTCIYLAVFIGLKSLSPSYPTDVMLPPIWIALIAARRLHDMGLSAWWGLSPFGLGVAVGFIKAFQNIRAGLQASTPTSHDALGSAIVGLISIAFIVWLAIPRGDAGPNRFSAERSRY